MQQAAAAGTGYDLAILDMKMPEMDGLALARATKLDPALAGVRLVLLTSFGQRGHGAEAAKIGIAAYLTKPVDEADLYDCLVEVLDEARARRAAHLVTRHSLREQRPPVAAHVLVAEDNEVNQKVAVEILEKLGYSVELAENGKEALAACARRRYDAVLMDGQMPGMDGYEATRRIRERETRGGRRVPIIAMTASAMKGDREKCLESGMDDYVTKPVTPENLEAVLRKWVGAASAPAERAAAGTGDAGGAARRGRRAEPAVRGRRRHADGRGGRDLPAHRSGPPRRDPQGGQGQRGDARARGAQLPRQLRQHRRAPHGRAVRAARGAGPLRLDRGRRRDRPHARGRARERAAGARGAAGAAPQARGRPAAALVIRGPLLALVEALFRVLFDYDCTGEEKLPATGPALVSANHPSYLDPVLLSLQVKRPILFMAWDRLFRVPLLGGVMRLFGAFPVDTAARARARTPTSGRSSSCSTGTWWASSPRASARATAGWSRSCAGAPRGSRSRPGRRSIPATIRGAFRAWPYFRALPEPAKIHVRYHDPIDPAAYRSLPRDEAIEALLAELRTRVDRTLLPGVKADRKIDALYRTSAPWPRLIEAVPALGLALFVFWKTRELALVWPCYAYIGYLLLDLLLVPQRRLTKWIRNGSAAVFIACYVAFVLPRLGLPAPIGRAALAALLLGAGFPYLYDRGRIALGFVQGLRARDAARARRAVHGRDADRAAPRAAALLRGLRLGGAQRLLALHRADPRGLRHRRSAVARRRRGASAARARGPPRVGARAPAAGRRRSGCAARRGETTRPRARRWGCATDAAATPWQNARVSRRRAPLRHDRRSFLGATRRGATDAARPRGRRLRRRRDRNEPEDLGRGGGRSRLLRRLDRLAAAGRGPQRPARRPVRARQRARQLRRRVARRSG